MSGTFYRSLSKAITLILGAMMSILQSCSTTSIDEQLANQIAAAFVKEQKQRYKLQVCGVGGSIPDKIRKFHFDFDLIMRVDREQAREIYVDMLEHFLQMVNSDEEIRPYLENYPVTNANVEILLTFCDKPLQRVPPPYMAFVFGCKNSIVYDQWDPVTEKFCDAYHELYADALKIVRGY